MRHARQYLYSTALVLSLAPLSALAQAVAIPATLPAGYYLSPSGSDSNTGGLNDPFLTLGKCQTTMRTGNKYCYLRAGKYTLPTGGLPLTTADNGETYQYYPPDGIGTAWLDLSATNTISINSQAVSITFNGLRIGNTAQIMVFSQGDSATWINNIFENPGITNSFYTLDIYGSNVLIAGNTFQNITNSNPGGDARAIALNANGLINSVVKNNDVHCVANWGLYFFGSTTGTIFYNNQFIGIGHYGGLPPGCGPQVDASGTGIDIHQGTDNAGNLFIGNTVSGVEGYAIVDSAGSSEYISGNNLSSLSDPVITLNGGPNTIIRDNIATSGASIGFNLGEEHDHCPRTATSNNLLVANNNVNATFEPLWLSNTANSNIFGNATGIGTVNQPAVAATFTGSIPAASTNLTTSASPGITPSATTALRGTGVTADTIITSGSGTAYTVSRAQTVASTAMNSGAIVPHYPAGIAMINWQYANFCSYGQSNNNNKIVNNTIISNLSGAKYGIYIETLGAAGASGYTAQTGNTVSHNTLFPCGASCTAALFDGGASTTAADNKTSAGTSVTLAPPTAHAGHAQIAAGGQLVTLDGSATANYPGGGTTGISYLWAQVSGPAVTLSSTTAVKPTFTAPAKPLTGAAILVFSLQATNANGFTTDKVMVGLDFAI